MRLIFNQLGLMTSIGYKVRKKKIEKPMKIEVGFSKGLSPIYDTP